MFDRCKITIITPTYNAGQFIEECVRSVTAQTFSDKEHLIVDGGSTDATLALVREYAAKYPHIRLISEPDDGIYDAMNKGLGLARGEWVYFLGSDDVLYSDVVLEKLFALAGIDDCDLVYGNVLWGDTGKFYDGKFSLPKLMAQNICHQAIIYKKSLFARLGNFDVRYKVWADYMFNIKAFTAENIKIRYVDAVLAKFSLNGASSQAVVDKDFLHDRESIYRSCFPPEYVDFHFKLLELADTVEALEYRVADRDKQIAELGWQIGKRDKQIAELELWLADKEERIKVLNSSVESLLNSFSWKVTRPVRALVDILTGRRK